MNTYFWIEIFKKQIKVQIFCSYYIDLSIIFASFIVLIDSSKEVNNISKPSNKNFFKSIFDPVHSNIVKPSPKNFRSSPHSLHPSKRNVFIIQSFSLHLQKFSLPTSRRKINNFATPTLPLSTPSKIKYIVLL